MSRDLHKPFVSVVMITYAHQDFIGDAIEGVLNQKGDFNLELIICDDASPDNTRDIVENYKIRYPQKNIKYIRQENNIGMSRNFLYSLREAQGHYIALCEGDDYWTDNFKLSKQIDILENNHSYSLCCHDVADQHGNKILTPLSVGNKHGRTQFGLEEFSRYWIIRTPSLVFRNNLIRLEDFRQYDYFRDRHLFYHLLKIGYGCYLHEIMAVYRIHQGGVHSGESIVIRLNTAIKVSEELWKKNRDEYTRFMYLRSLLNRGSYKSLLDRNFISELKPLVRSFDDLVLIIKSITPNFIKKIVK